MKQAAKSKWVQMPLFVTVFLIEGSTNKAVIPADTEAIARKLFKKHYPRQQIRTIQVRYGQLQ